MRRRSSDHEFRRMVERKDVYIGTYGGAHNHFWLNNLKLGHLKVENFRGGDNLPSVISLDIKAAALN